MQGKNDTLADKVLLSNAIFNGLENEASPGFIALRGECIAAVGRPEEAQTWIGRERLSVIWVMLLSCQEFMTTMYFLPDICRCIGAWI